MKRLNAFRNRMMLSTAIVTQYAIEQANARAFMALQRAYLGYPRGKLEAGDVIHGTLRNGEIYLDVAAE